MGSILNPPYNQVHYYPCCRTPIKQTEGFILYLLQMATLQSFRLFKK